MKSSPSDPLYLFSRRMLCFIFEYRVYSNNGGIVFDDESGVKSTIETGATHTSGIQSIQVSN